MWVFLAVYGHLLLMYQPQIYEQYEDKWEVIRVTHAAMSKEEEDEREEALAEVADPMFLMARGDADADGEIEIDDTGIVNGGLDFGA
jgi:RNA polymerase II-associated factor 1